MTKEEVEYTCMELKVTHNNIAADTFHIPAYLWNELFDRTAHFYFMQMNIVVSKRGDDKPFVTWKTSYYDPQEKDNFKAHPIEGPLL